MNSRKALSLVLTLAMVMAAGCGRTAPKAYTPDSTATTETAIAGKDTETINQVLFYRKGFTYDNVTNDFDYNVTLISDVEKDSYFKRYLREIN